jgi:prolyl-tRNA editing enzyme YbaK/EbsC (Cys-tRNA(Pro) deacylase)
MNDVKHPEQVMPRVVNALRASRMPYELLAHEQLVRGAQDGASLLGLALYQTAPSLVLQTNKGPLVAIVPGDRRLSIKKLKKALRLKNASLAKSTVVEAVTGCQPGSVPIVNFDIPTVVDAGVLRQPWVYGGSGTWDHTLKMRPSDIVLLTDAKILDITEEREIEGRRQESERVH